MTTSGDKSGRFMPTLSFGYTFGVKTIAFPVDAERYPIYSSPLWRESLSPANSWPGSKTLLKLGLVGRTKPIGSPAKDLQSVIARGSPTAITALKFDSVFFCMDIL
jgi:hypothetical protein